MLGDKNRFCLCYVGHDIVKAATRSQVKTGLFCPCSGPPSRRPARLLAVVAALVVGLSTALHAGDTALASRAEAAFLAARAAFATNRLAVGAAWNLGRTAFDWAEFQSRDADRARIAEEGIAACRAAVSNAPASAPAHYYLALCRGQLAQTRRLSALKLVAEMEADFLAASTLDQTLDHAGPDRGLGLLYLQAPGWPTSIGSKSKARQHLERAVSLDPDHPENRIALAEALLRWKEREAARDQLDALEKVWEAARRRLTGPDWEGAWADWTPRREALAKRLRAGKAGAAASAAVTNSPP